MYAIIFDELKFFLQKKIVSLTAKETWCTYIHNSYACQKNILPRDEN